MRRGVRVAVSILAWIPILLGIMYLAAGLSDGYMVTVGGVAPGEPMSPDDLAYPLRDAIYQGALGLGLITLGAIVRTYVSRRATETRCSMP